MTTPRTAPVLAFVAAAVAATVGRTDSPRSTYVEIRAALVAAQAHVVDAAAALGRADPPTSAALVDEAMADVVGVAPRGSSLRDALGRLSRRLVRTRAVVASADAAADATPAVRAVARAAAYVRVAIAALGSRGAGGCALVELRGTGASIHRPGFRSVFRVVGTARGAAPTVTTTNDDPAFRALDPVVTALGHGRFRVVWGPDLGAATVTATCGTQASLRAFCVGRPGALAATPAGPPDYGPLVRFARVGSLLDSAAPTVAGDGPFSFEAEPSLADGLSLDPATGAISGTPTAAGPAATYRITVRNVRSAAQADVAVDVDPALPDRVEDLAGGFAIEPVAEDPAMAVKMAFAPDGRLFFSELTTGKIRVIDSSGTLLDTPLATVPILQGPEQGLFGIAVAPDFAASGHVYVVASAPAGGGKPDRNRILRYVATGDVAVGPEVIVDDLPIGISQNGGHLAFGPDGDLYATTGDTGDPPLAQEDGSLAGRVLRIAPDGSAPAGNPVPGSFEWCRGFRNPFSIAFDPATGLLFATDNGPAAHDELDFVQPGKNYLWGAAPDAYFGAQTGIRVFDWTPVIVPTGIAFHDGRQFGSEYAGNLFLGSYDLAQVRRLVLEGIDLRSASVFVQFSDAGLAQKPLDVALSPDGSLWVSTFETIWRIRRD